MTGSLPNLLRLVVIALLWGSTWLAGDAIGLTRPPLTVLALRYGLAACALAPFALVASPARKGVRPVQAAVLGLTFFAVPGLLVTWSSSHGAGNAVPLLYAALPLGFSIAAGQLSVPALVGLSAVAVLLAEVLPHTTEAWLWSAPAVVAVLFQGWSISRVSRQAEQRSLQGLTLQCASAACTLSIAAALSEHPSFSAIPTQAWLAVGALALLPTALAYILFYRVLAGVPPAQATAAAQWLQLLVTVYESAWLLHARPTALMLAASAVLLVSLGALLTERPQDTLQLTP